MPFHIIRQDITKMNTDAIVNAANTELLPGGGVCGAVFAAAGYGELERECRGIGHCDTGKAVITRGYRLKAKYIIHTPGPIYDPDRKDNEQLLYSCYRSSLELAKEHGISSIAFPLISAGIYGYPAQEALSIAQRAIADFLEDSDMDVSLVVYDRNSFMVSKDVFDDVKEYIDQRLVKEQDIRSRRHKELFMPGVSRSAVFEGAYPMYAPMAPSAEKAKAEEEEESLEDMIRRMDSSFSEHLFYLIDKSGMTDVQVYKKANIDRKLFSKIRSNMQYKPKKTTAVALAIALELDMEEMRSLVGRAGYSLSHSSIFDIIIEYYVMRKNYNIFEINEMLFAFDQPLIG